MESPKNSPGRASSRRRRARRPKSDSSGATRLPLYVLAIPARVYDNRRVARRAPGGTTSEYHPQ
jgi:hypothetical protein